MLYLYDNAICEDLEQSFNPNAVGTTGVKVIDPESAINLLAQMKDDDIDYPAVVLTRNTDLNIDSNQTNFTRIHRGVATVLDPKTNNLYYERVVPVNLQYKLTVLATNTADQDELVRELLFKYEQMYFLTIQLPYECERKVRFGLAIDHDTAIQYDSTPSTYLQTGKVYQAIITLRCEGTVLVSYTPAHLRRTQHEIIARAQGQPLD